MRSKVGFFSWPSKYIFLAFLIPTIILLTSTEAFSRDITAADFRGSKFRGFHIEGVSNGIRSDSDLDALARTGANLVRISVFLRRCNDCNTYALSENDLKTLDLQIRALSMRDIYTYIVLRPNGDERGVLWSSPALRKSFIEQWNALSQRYKNTPSVAAFDLLNEPVPPGLNYDIRQTTWLDFAKEVATSIRSFDPSRVLIVESAPDATPSSFSNMRPIPLDNVVYSFHSYSPFNLTHQGVYSGLNQKLTYGPLKSNDFTKEDLFSLLNIVDNFSIKYNVPIIVGEFSMVRYAPTNSAINYLNDSVEYFETKGWSWTYHDFRGWPGWDSEIDSNSPNFNIRTDNAPVISILRKKMLAIRK